MEVIKEKSEFLCNYEVLDLLKNLKTNKKQKMTQNQLATITYQTIRYLEETPCKNQTPEKIKKYMEAVEPFNLTKCEKLNLLNNRPTSQVEIQLMVEDSEERLSEEEVESLLQIINTHLGDTEPEVEVQEQT